MGDEATEENRRSLAAPFVFLIVASLQYAYYWLDHLKKNGTDNVRESQLRSEIKQLLKEASLLSQPSTFAQAAKLRRLAAAKERELAKYQNSYHKDYTLYWKVVLVTKYIMYAVLLLWFWRAPVASISQQLVQPFGRFLSWRTTTGVQNNNAMVGIICWLVVSARVCRFVRRAYSK